jgi:hypothetical protein
VILNYFAVILIWEVDMMAIRMAALLLTLLTAAACTSYAYQQVLNTRGEAKDTRQSRISQSELRAWAHSVIEQTVTDTIPLATTIGGPAVFVFPTPGQFRLEAQRYREQIADNIENFQKNRFNRPSGIYRPVIVTLPTANAADMAEEEYLSLARIIQRRNIFTTLKTVRSDAAEGLSAPEGGYLIRLDLPALYEPKLYIKAAGEAPWTPLPSYVGAGAASERRFAAIRAEMDSRAGAAPCNSIHQEPCDEVSGKSRFFDDAVEQFVKTHTTVRDAAQSEK